MARTLTLDINDAQEAFLTEIATTALPAAPPAQKLAWVNAQVREAVRDHFRNLHVQQAARRAVGEFPDA